MKSNVTKAPEKLICCLCGEEIDSEISIRIKEKNICNACSEELCNILDWGEKETEIPDMDVKNISTKSTKNNRKKKIDLSQLVKRVGKYIKGQDELVKRVSFTILKNQKYPIRKSNIMIVGNSGTGKTQTLKSIFESLNIPYIIEDITSYTEAGYVGNNVDDMIKKMYFKYGSLKAIEKAVVIIDEFDKLAAVAENSGKDVSGKGVQKSLLKLLEGKLLNIELDMWGTTIQVDTSKMTFVLLGVFPEVVKKREERLKIRKNNCLGFSAEPDNLPKQEVEEFISDDFEAAGFMPEIIGRVKVILETNPLTEKDYLDILKTSRLSSLKDIREDFKAFGIRLAIKSGTLEAIAHKAFLYKTGARAINKVLEDSFSKVLYQIDSTPNKKYSFCVITPDTVNNNSKYYLK